MADSTTPPTASQSLYRKYRSRDFADLAGQEHVKQTLRNAVRSDSVGHAYLLTGPRGTGKTSTARILARAVNCLSPREGEPCNECIPCRDILAGRSLDVIEIDAASKGGVEDARDLRDKAGYSPSELRRKVYIIDEVHMLSVQAFNALLKTLEEPPAHVLFVLATTDVHKVLTTITSRCQRLDFRPISSHDVVERLAFVCDQEGISAAAAALDLLAQHATGSLRDALSLLDQVRAYEGAVIGVAEVEAALGLTSSNTLYQLTDDIARGDAGAALALIGELVSGGADMRQYARQLVQHWRDLMLTKAGGREALGRTPDSRLTAQAERLSVGDIAAIFKSILQPDYSGRKSASAQWQLELAVVEACQYFAGERAGQAPRGEFAPPSARAVVASGSEEREPPRQPAVDAPEPRESRAAASIPSSTGADGATAAPTRDLDPDPDAELGIEQSSHPVRRHDAKPNGAESVGAMSLDARAAQKLWAEVRPLLPPRVDATVRESCRIGGLHEGVFTIEILPSSKQAFYKSQLEATGSRAKIEGALAGLLGRAVSLRCVTISGASAMQSGSVDTPHESFKERVERDLRSVHIERDPV